MGEPWSFPSQQKARLFYEWNDFFVLIKQPAFLLPI